MMGKIITDSTIPTERIVRGGVAAGPANSGTNPRWSPKKSHAGCNRGKSHNAPHKPYTTEGIAASKSIRYDSVPCRRRGVKWLKNSATPTDTGTEIIRAISAARTVPKASGPINSVSESPSGNQPTSEPRTVEPARRAGSAWITRNAATAARTTKIVAPAAVAVRRKSRSASLPVDFDAGTSVMEVRLPQYLL